jgi:hypothetical protein
VTSARTSLRHLARLLTLTALFVLLTASEAVADIQATPNTPPDSSKCSLAGPSSQCGQWTYWAALGAILIGVVAVALFVIKYLRDAPRFQVDTPSGARAGSRPSAGASRPLAPPPPASAAAPAPASAAPAQAQPATAAAAPAAGATAVAVAEPPAAQGEQESAPAVAGNPAGGAVATRAPSPRAEHVEPDQETYDRVLAEQVAKGTDRRVAEGRAKAAALKAAREKAAGG